MKAFWMDTLERALKTAAQTAIAAIGTTATLGDVNWIVVASTVGMATVLSVLTSVASRPVGNKSTASLAGKNEKK